MASLKSQKAAAANAVMAVDGRGAFSTDKRIITVAPTAADTIDFFLPAGTHLCTLATYNDDLDTGAALLYGVGYRPVSSADGSLAADTAYFAAAGQTAFRAAGRVEYAFKPIKFEQDVYISILIGTAPAGISGSPEIHLIAGYAMVGPK